MSLPRDLCKHDPCNFPTKCGVGGNQPRLVQLMSASVYKILPWQFCATKSTNKIRLGWSWPKVWPVLPTFQMNNSKLNLQGSLLQRSSGNAQMINDFRFDLSSRKAATVNGWSSHPEACGVTPSLALLVWLSGHRSLGEHEISIWRLPFLPSTIHTLAGSERILQPTT